MPVYSGTTLLSEKLVSALIGALLRFFPSTAKVDLRLSFPELSLKKSLQLTPVIFRKFVMNRIELFRRGIFVSSMPSEQNLLQIIESLRPVVTEGAKWNGSLVRIGSKHDGGYLVPNDLENISACFSAGVADNSSFEMSLESDYGIPSHLADLQVSGPNHHYKTPKSFLKKNISAYNSSETITLDRWVDEYEPLSEHHDQELILQMDIEGGEYPVLLGTSLPTLLRFRIMILEVHQVWAWGNDSFFNIVKEFFQKILNEFNCVHLHPNNSAGSISLGEIIVPQAFEITFLRKDRSSDALFTQFAALPNLLDSPNDPSIPELYLPPYWMGK